MQKPDLTLFPKTPGVYLFKDSSGRILYVGKAKRLRNRLASYFRPEHALTPKTRLMVSAAHSIDFLRTETEKEALLLEASLIKKHRPRYNIVLRDDKEYLLFRIGNKHPFPRLEIIRKNSMKKGESTSSRGTLFGPYSSASAARETWKLIHKNFPLRRCRDRSFSNRTRPCLYYHIGLCLGPCSLDVSDKEYKNILRKVSMLLSGKSDTLVETIESEMFSASEDMEYEKAAILRDQLQAVKRTIEHQSVVLAKETDLDIIGVSETAEGLALGVVFIRGGLLLDGRNFFWPSLTVEDTPELLTTFIPQYYLQGKATPPRRVVIPWLPKDTQALSKSQEEVSTDEAFTGEEFADELAFASEQQKPLFFKNEQALHRKNTPCTDNNCSSSIQVTESEEAFINTISPNNLADIASTRDNTTESISLDKSEGATLVDEGKKAESSTIEAFESLLSEVAGYNVTISIPKNRDEDRLMVMASSNAREAAKQCSTKSLSELLAHVFKTEQPIRRIEAVDISHTSGSQTKAGMVVFEDEQPCKKDYRQYSLDEDLAEAGAEAGDDYAALTLWAKRRAKAGAPWADLVLIDGGKGQLAAVHRAFMDAGVAHAFILASIAKARDEEGHTDRRAGNISDRIFLPLRSNPLPLKPGSAELLFLQRVRDTVHDYVIGRHRQARAAVAMSGELTRLQGVGPKTAQLLYKHFDSLAAMAEAGEQGLAKIPGIGKSKAIMLTERIKKLVKN